MGGDAKQLAAHLQHTLRDGGNGGVSGVEVSVAWGEVEQWWQCQ